MMYKYSMMYLEVLRKKAKKSDGARWMLGEILHEAVQSGYTVKVTKDGYIIEKGC